MAWKETLVAFLTVNRVQLVSPQIWKKKEEVVVTGEVQLNVIFL